MDLCFCREWTSHLTPRLLTAGLYWHSLQGALLKQVASGSLRQCLARYSGIRSEIVRARASVVFVSPGVMEKKVEIRPLGVYFPFAS